MSHDLVNTFLVEACLTTSLTIVSPQVVENLKETKENAFCGNACGNDGASRTFTFDAGHGYADLFEVGDEALFHGVYLLFTLMSQ